MNLPTSVINSLGSLSRVWDEGESIREQQGLLTTQRFTYEVEFFLLCTGVPVRSDTGLPVVWVFQSVFFTISFGIVITN